MAALSTSNVKRTVSGSNKVLLFDFTHSEGDAAPTLVVDGTRVYDVALNSEDTTQPVDKGKPRYSVSVSGNLATITLYLLEGVTTGRGRIEYR